MIIEHVSMRVAVPGDAPAKTLVAELLSLIRAASGNIDAHAQRGIADDAHIVVVSRWTENEDAIRFWQAHAAQHWLGAVAESSIGSLTRATYRLEPDIVASGGEAPAFVVAQVRVHAPHGYGDYASLVRPTLARYAGRVIVRSAEPRCLEGRPCDRVVVVRFDSESAARRWYDSPEYTHARTLRQRMASSDIQIAPGS